MCSCVNCPRTLASDVAGKHSPGKELYEWKWSREICKRIVNKLQNDGYRAVIDTESDYEIGLANRVQIEHNYSNLFGKKNTLFFSVHCNAAGSDNKWHNARGFSVFVCKNCSENSKRIADLVFDAIEKQGIKTRKPLPKQKYWEANFYVIKNTWSPACLVESSFMDNHADCELLLSKEGKDKFCAAYVEAIETYVDELIVE